MEQFMKRTLKRTRTEEEYYELGEEPIKRHKVESITTPMLLPTFSTMPTSLPSPEEESTHEAITTATTTTTTNQEAMLKSFVISTKKNTQYNQINDLLHQIHIMRYGDPELRERWWEQDQEQQQQEEYNHHYNYYQQQQQQQQLKQEIQMNKYIQQGGSEEIGTIYETANATLRDAFLQRHHHHHAV